MGILDQIAGGSMQGFASGLKIGQNIKDRQAQARMDEINTGIALRKMQAENEALKQQSQGFSTIKDYYASQQQPGQEPQGNAPVAPGPQGNVPIDQPGQPQPEQAGQPQAAPGEQPAGPQPMQAIAQIPTDAMNNMEGLDKLTGELMSNPQMQSQAVMFSNMAKNARAHLEKQSEAKRAEGAKLSTIAGGMFEGVARLEEAGDIQGAQKQWTTVMNFMKNDPNFQKNEDTVKFLESHKDYNPGSGKLMLLATMTGLKARDQLQEETKMAETKRHNVATETISAEKADLASKIKKLKEDKPESFKSADARAIYSFAVGYHGGTFDENGNPKILDPELTKDVQKLSAKAADLYANGKAKTHNEAISMAAEQLKMETKWPWQETGAKGQPKTPKVDISGIAAKYPKSVAYLKANPDQLEAFNKQYGEGAGEAVLGQ